MEYDSAGRGARDDGAPPSGTARRGRPGLPLGRGVRGGGRRGRRRQRRRAHHDARALPGRNGMLGPDGEGVYVSRKLVGKARAYVKAVGDLARARHARHHARTTTTVSKLDKLETTPPSSPAIGPRAGARARARRAPAASTGGPMRQSASATRRPSSRSSARWTSTPDRQAPSATPSSRRTTPSSRISAARVRPGDGRDGTPSHGG